jgi:two-component system chemotaxis sensor kinase CheA
LALNELPLAVAEASTDVGAAAPAAAAPVSTPSQVVRVDLARLDELMQAVGNLVITRARLADSLSRAERHVPSAEWRSVQENAQLLDRQLRTLREGIMRVRLVQIGEIFRRMPFVVRDLARETNKKVALHLEGQTTEIDKFLIERIADPIVHLVRNAVSHGIETPDARIAAGKAPDGTLTLRASTSGDIVRIEIADDGRGIDGGRIFERAHALGLSTTGDPSDPAAVLAVICAPGFSTRDAADRASGRGVGMAVVKNTIEQLSGTLSLDTAPGEGTRFIIQLPLTLAITDALIGRVGTEAFAIPQSAVREVLEVSRSQLRAIEGNELVPYRDSSLPVVHIAKVFGIATTPSDRFHVFVVGSGTSALGFAVDRIVGQREVVVRAIADPLVRVDGVAGATDLGDGRVVLILDPATLSRGRQRSVTG